ncbi:hypothetical protein REPUB_Repub02eG0234200 [Reevesia pubescens]
MYGLNTAALSNTLFNNGTTCGACFEIKCINSPEGCKPGQASLIVTARDHCPPNNNLPSDNGGWHNEPRQHFDLAKPAFLQIAEEKAGIIPVQYRRVPCMKQGGIRFTITGNPYFNLVSISNVGGAGDEWQNNAMLIGEDLSFRVTTSDGKTTTAWYIVPKNWQFGLTFESRKNFKGIP